MNAQTHAIDEILAAGTLVGRHRIVGKLAQGAHAILYMGEHQVTRAEVAIKVLRSAYRSDGEMHARFDREARVMGRLAGCSEIVQVHDAGELHDGRRFLVMEFVRGRDLSTLLVNARRRQVPMGFDRIIAIARALASALRDAHGKGVVHRDLKPSNVMIARRPDGHEHAKLVDFGVSGDLEVQGTAAELTIAGAVIGTPEYMSPEQAVGLPASVSMDLFALGLVMFEMITGSLPTQPVLRQGAAPRVATLRPDVPAALDTLVFQCLLPDSRVRVADAIEVLSWLTRASEQLEGKAESHAWAEGRLVRAAGTIAVVPSGSSPAASGAASGTADLGSAARKAAASRLSRRRGVMLAVVVGGGLLSGLAVWRWTSWAAADRESFAQAERAATPSPVGVGARVEPQLRLVASPPTAPSVKSPSPPSVPASAPQVNNAPEKPIAEPKPGKPPVAGAECVAHRDAAARASDALEWREVLEHTRSAGCWADRTARLRLRVEALAELSRHADCVNEGDGLADALIMRTVALCRKRLDAG